MLKGTKYLLLITLIVWAIILKAQTLKTMPSDDLTIHITANPVFLSLNPIFINVYRINDKIKIVYLVERGRRRNDLADEKDSLLLDRKKVIAYDSLLDRIGQTSAAELENREANKNRYLLDGIFFSVKVISKSGNIDAWAQSPDPLSHPLLYSLLTQTFAVYRNTKNNDFLDKKKTFGY